MADILEFLHQDHINYAHLLDLMQDEIDSLAHGGKADFNLLYDIMCYLTEYPDTVHHPLEERIFEQLPLLTTNKVLLGNVNKLGHEHESIYKAGEKLKTDVHSVVAGAVIEKQRILDDARNYHQLLKQHMNTEEGTVFQQIKDELNNEQRQQINALMEDTEDPLFGSVVLQQFQRIHRGIIDQATIS